MWKSRLKYWFYWIFWWFLIVENLCDFLGQNVDKSGDFFTQRHFCVKMSQFSKFCQNFTFPQNPVERGFLPEFSQCATENCQNSFAFCLCKAKFSTSQKINKINASLCFEYHFFKSVSTSFKHCGKTVDKWNEFPQFHNLLTI